MCGMATVVVFNAHPDDEALFSGGTLARLAAEGNRVVIVMATEATGLRLDELRKSAAILGAARVEDLGYANSGHGPLLYDDPPGRQRFVRADLDEPVCLLRLVTTYRFDNPYTPRRAITHRVDVRRYAAVKQAAIAAYRSQMRSPVGYALTHMPTPLFRLLLGREWLAGPPATVL